MNFNSGTCFSIYALKHKMNPHHYKALHCIKTIKIQIIVSTSYFLILSAAKSQREAPLPPATLIQWLPDLWLERLDQTFGRDSFLEQFMLQRGPLQIKLRLDFTWDSYKLHVWVWLHLYLKTSGTETLWD